MYWPVLSARSDILYIIQHPAHNNCLAGAQDCTGMDQMFAAASSGVDIPRLVPNERWAIDSFFSPEVTVDKMYVRHAGFIQGVQNFDAAVFR